MAIAPDSPRYLAYRQALVSLDKQACVQIALEMLESQEASLVDVYRDLLARTLNEIVDAELTADDAIWKEHVRSEITRTVLECCYPYVQSATTLRQAELTALLRQRSGPDSSTPDLGQTDKVHKVMIVLPAEEYHELGARMGADFFAINGFDTLFLGSNTPRESTFNCIRAFQPDFIDIHVVNYYNMFRAKELIIRIRNQAPSVQILASGYAFKKVPQHADFLKPTRLILSYEDIASLREDLL